MPAPTGLGLSMQSDLERSKQDAELKGGSSFSVFKTPIKKLLLPFLAGNSKQNGTVSHLQAPGNSAVTPISQSLHSSENFGPSRECDLQDTPASILQSIKTSSLLLEYSSLRVCAPPGCYIVPDSADFHIWHGVLFMHEGPFAGLVLRFSIHWNLYKNQADSLFLLNSCTNLNELADCSISKCLSQLPLVNINSPSGLFVHPLVKNLNQLDISFFVVQRLLATKDETSDAPQSKRVGIVNAGTVLDAIFGAFSQDGLDSIAGCADSSELAPFISNIDAWKILKNDRQTFGKLAQDMVKATLGQESLYASIEGCPFQFKPDS